MYVYVKAARCLLELRCLCSVVCGVFFLSSLAKVCGSGGGGRETRVVSVRRANISVSLPLVRCGLRPPQKTKKADGNYCVRSWQGGGGEVPRGFLLLNAENTFIETVFYLKLFVCFLLYKEIK